MPLSPEPILIQAHRGAGFLDAENTAEALELGWSFGMVPEVDVNTTRDGELIAFHDRDLARVVRDLPPTLAGKTIHDVDWREVRELDVGGPDRPRRIPTIAAIFSTMARDPRRRLYLDIKQVDFTRLAALVREHGLGGRVILATNHHEWIRQWRALIPDGETLLWIATGPRDQPLAARLDSLRADGFAGITQVQVHLRVADDGGWTPEPDRLLAVQQELHTRGILFQVFPMTAEPAVYRRLLDRGVRSFTTDHPSVLRGLLPSPYAELLRDASDTRELVIDCSRFAAIGPVFARLFPGRPALLVADATTDGIAGQAVAASLASAGITLAGRHLLAGAKVEAEWSRVEELVQAIGATTAIPIAIGAGTINDLVKLAAHRCDRAYLCAATAASMDGYAAFGASITREGSKQTFACPAPRAIVADLDVIATAPPAMTAAGYADLLAKVVAGADWIIADALGIEGIGDQPWRLAQDSLRAAVGEPQRLAQGDPAAFAALLEGLIRSGLAMQAARSSRPASGAEHQFSHLWDMEGGGRAFPHGFKVGIGTLASAALYHRLLAEPVEAWDVPAMAAGRPEWAQVEGGLRRMHSAAAVLATALVETRAKHVTAAELIPRLTRLQQRWPAVRERLRTQVPSPHELRRLLLAAGAPVTPAAVAVSLADLRASHRRAMTIRRRYTILDLADESGRLDAWLEHLFAPGGFWS